MKIDEICSRYNIDEKDFESFLFFSNLKYEHNLFGKIIIADRLVDEYVKRFIRHQNSENAENNEPSTEIIADVETKKSLSFESYNKGMEKPANGAIYSINGVRGRHIDVFDNKCIIKTKVTIGSLLTHNATDGTKTIYYADVVGVQFKEPGITIGYLQLETPGLTMNNAASNFFNENSFTFDTTVIATEKMREIAAYIEERVQEIKRPKQETQTVAPAVPQISVADELLKFKQLLDMGALTQEEFDAKKKELLNL